MSLPNNLKIILSAGVVVGILALAYYVSYERVKRASFSLVSPKPQIQTPSSAPSNSNISNKGKAGPNASETKLATISENQIFGNGGISSLDSIIFSPDGTKAAYKINSRGGIGDDGQTGDSASYIVVNDKESPVYDFIGEYAFSPDSKQFAYVAGRSDNNEVFKTFIVLNGKELNSTFTEISSLTFSPDSQHFAYEAEKGDNKSLVVSDGKESVIYNSVEGLVFSPDSKRLAYVTKKGDKWLVVLDGKEGPLYDKILSPAPVFSPDGEQLAYYAQGGDKTILVVNGKEISTSYDDISDFTFSPNNELVYSARKGNDMFLVKNGKEEATNYKQIKNLVFSPDSKQLAFTVAKDKGVAVVLNGQKADTSYDEINNLTFSPDSKHFAYEAGIKGKGWLIVSDGKEGTIYGQIWSSPIFSPDSSKLVYIAEKGDKKIIILNGNESPTYDNVQNLGFTSDGNYITYGTQTGDELWWRVNKVDVSH